MAKKSLEEFGYSMGMPYDTVKKNAQRGNIIRGTDGLIDTENPVNKVFYDKKTALKGTKSLQKESISKEKKAVAQPIGLTSVQKQYADLDLRTKIATAESKERENELRRIQLEKIAGSLLPVELCEKILVINIQSILKSFRSERENMASIFIERLGGSRKDLVEINSELDKMLDVAVKKAQKDATYEIVNAINDFQDVRGRGERK
jgi:hypothetical protein